MTIFTHKQYTALLSSWSINNATFRFACLFTVVKVISNQTFSFSDYKSFTWTHDLQMLCGQLDFMHIYVMNKSWFLV